MTGQSTEWFAAELAKTGRLDRQDRTGAWIVCPNPDHSGGQERTGSLHVNLEKQGVPVGYFHCLGCGYKGNWNKLAEQLKMKQLLAKDKVHTALDFTFDEEEVPPLPDIKKMIPWPLESWRTIPRETLRDYEVRTVFNQKRLTAYIPVFAYKKQVGGIFARAEITKEQRASGWKPYIFTPGPWKSKYLFGFDFARKREGPLWIVEGARDAMKVHSFGARVVATLGANLSHEQRLLLDVLDPELIVIASDPDSAGDKLARQIEDHYSNTVRIDFPEGKDAANLTQKRYDKIASKLEDA